MLRTRRTFIFVSIMLLGLLLAFLLHLNATAQGPDEFETYQAADGSFSFQVPPDWYTVEEFGVVLIGNTERAVASFGVEGREILIIMIPPAMSDAMIGVSSAGSPTVVMERLIEATSGGNLTTYAEPEGVILGDTVAVRAAYRDFETEGWVYMIDAGNDTVMMVVAAAPLDELEQYEESVFAVINSIQFQQTRSDTTPSDESAVAVVTQVIIVTATPILEATLPPQPTLLPTTIPAPTLDVMPSFTATPIAGPLFTTTPIRDEQNVPNFEATITALESTIVAWENNATASAGLIGHFGYRSCGVYIVQEGDTLSSIAATFDTNVIDLMTVNGLEDESNVQIGQAFFIPSETCPPESFVPIMTPTPSATGTLFPTVASLSSVQIVTIGGAGDIDTEVVEILNVGDTADLTGWTLEDEDGHSFTFPQMRLFNNASLRLFTRIGQNTPVVLYWNEDMAIWQDGETATLFDADGNVVSTFVVGED